MTGEATWRLSVVSRLHILNLSTFRPDFEPQKEISVCMFPAGTVTVKSLAASMIPKVCRLDRTATIMIDLLQTTPKVAQPIVMVLSAFPDLTVKKAPSLILLILSSAMLM